MADINNKNPISWGLKIAKNQENKHKFTRLEPKNKRNDIVEGIQARIKDPCWLLGRQWQMGEFKAENGGSPVKTEISYVSEPLTQISKGGTKSDLASEEPLEMAVEKDAKKGSGWNEKHLEYSFTIKGENVSLSAEEYDGNRLEWYHLDIDKEEGIAGQETDLSLHPQRLGYRGMPHPRWWTFEDQKIDVGNIQRPYLNYLTMLLMEFSLSYSNDWFLVPIDHRINHIRKITRFKVMDSFGVITDYNPVVDPSQERKGWEMFTIAHKNRVNASDGALFYMPNTLMGGELESEPIEEVSLMRDELANLVWAIEHKYQNSEGEVITRHDEELDAQHIGNLEENEEIYYWDMDNEILVNREDENFDEIKIGTKFLGPVAKYNFMSYVPPYWIPYVAQQLSNKEDIILRRGTTKVDASDNPQYKGEFLAESTFIYEEEVPKSGVFLKRVWQLARDINGNYYNWLGRKKSQDMRRRSSGLRFDYLESNK